MYSISALGRTFIRLEIICGNLWNAALVAIANSTYIYVILPIALLSGLAAIIEIRIVRKLDNQIKDSPVTIENLAKFGLRLAVINV